MPGDLCPFCIQLCICHFDKRAEFVLDSLPVCRNGFTRLISAAYQLLDLFVRPAGNLNKLGLQNTLYRVFRRSGLCLICRF